MQERDVASGRVTGSWLCSNIPHQAPTCWQTPGSAADSSSSSCLLACSPGLPQAMFSSLPAPPPRRRLHAIHEASDAGRRATHHLTDGQVGTPGMANTAKAEHAWGTTPRVHRTCCRLRRAPLDWCSPATYGPLARTARHGNRKGGNCRPQHVRGSAAEHRAW
jgi:hypothetical protein